MKTEPSLQAKEQNYCYNCGEPCQGMYCNMECCAADQDNDFDDDESDDDDELEMAINECGQMADGSCGMVGSEYCEFECPFRKDLF